MPRQSRKPESPVPVWREREKVFTWEEEPVLLCKLCSLQLSPGLERPGRYYKRLEAVWTARWEKLLYPRACAALQAARTASRPFRPWEASLTGTVTLCTPERLSLCLEAAERLDGPHTVVLRHGDTWELPACRPVPLSALFPAGFGWRRWVLDEVARQIQARQQAGEARFYPDWARRLPRCFDPERFYLTAEGPVVFFPLYALGPYVEGVPTFPLSLPAQETGAESGQV